MNLVTDFQKPEWRIVPAAEENYGMLENKVHVTLESGNNYVVYIAVPTGMFKYMKDVMKITNQKISLYLDESGKEWVFGISVNGSPRDLWVERSLPGWANK